MRSLGPGLRRGDDVEDAQEGVAALAAPTKGDSTRQPRPFR